MKKIIGSIIFLTLALMFIVIAPGFAEIPVPPKPVSANDIAAVAGEVAKSLSPLRKELNDGNTKLVEAIGAQTSALSSKFDDAKTELGGISKGLGEINVNLAMIGGDNGPLRGIERQTAGISNINANTWMAAGLMFVGLIGLVVALWRLAPALAHAKKNGRAKKRKKRKEE